MSVALLVITDGRDDYLRQCIASVDSPTGLHGDVAERWMYDDTGDAAYRRELAARYPGWRHINAGPRQGCAGAIRAAWQHLRDGSNARLVFHLEQDFVFRRPVDLAALVQLLDDYPELAQVALRRQPCNPLERQAGGIVESHPDWYLDRSDGDIQWLEHRAFFTCNPCLYRRTLLQLDWPEHIDGRYSEDTFHRQLLRYGTPEADGDHVHCAFWGARDSGVWVEHIGDARHEHGKDY
jgi:hypothetical protein